MTTISLFDGIGGFLLAAEGAGWKPGLSSEIDPFCKRVLKYHFPNIYHHGDIHTLDYGTIDTELSARFGDWRRDGVILSGGFPCQGFSSAGKRLGTNDDRYLWPQMLRVIQEVRPDWVVGENVTGILSMEDQSGLRKPVFAQVEGRKITRYADFDHYEGIYTRQAPMLVASIIEDLEKEGYEVQVFAIPAASVEAPHERERIWFVAHATGEQCQNGAQDRQRPDRKEEGAGMDDRPSVYGDAQDATNACMQRQQGEGNISIRSREGELIGHGSPDDTYSEGIRMERNRPDREQEPHPQSREGLFGRNDAGGYWAEWPTQPPLCTRDDGLSERLVGITFSKWREGAIRALGNAIVPQVAFEIFTAINQIK